MRGPAHVRVWAPRPGRVEVVTESGERTALVRDGDGYFAGVFKASPGDRYRFKLDDDEKLYPDPASRFQPDGPHGASELVDPRTFAWTDQSWEGPQIDGQIVYEMHVGTFTPAGTWAAAAKELQELARIGVTMIEVMPVAEFDGRFGWGYDGVDLYAPTHLYGSPDDFRRFVDTAHGCGVAVILDVVYNHLGPVGNYLRAFSPAYFTDRYRQRVGRRVELRRPGRRTRPRVLHDQRRLLDRGISPRRPAPRRDAADLRSIPGVHRDGRGTARP
jgi:maltooligosyltrehalose trehalohydrolase